jgi:hypothetical protein
MSDWMKKTCSLCPFSRSKTLFLHPRRAEEFADMASDRYRDFPCHKTADCKEGDDGWGEGDYVRGEHSKTCHGFLTLQNSENGIEDPDFVPDGDGFEDTYEMMDRHLELFQPWGE